MKRYSLTHLSDDVLLRDLAAVVARERNATADVLAHIAEVDARKLYLPAAYPSMFAYCVGELRLSEDAAFRRITAARAARRFPAIFEALAEGRLHLAGVNLLAPRLTDDTVAELLSAAAGRTKAQIEKLLAERFPQSDVLAWVEAIPAASPARRADPLGPGRVDDLPSPVPPVDQLVPGRVDWPPSPPIGQAPHAPAHGGAYSRVAPLSAQSYAMQVTLSAGTHDKLRRAQDLLSARVPSGDLAEVLDRVLDLAIASLEKQKFAATPRPRRGRRASAPDSRHVPAHVRRAVWERDGGRCTFESETGRRCEARRGLQFDHVEEFARGGETDATNIRLLCRAHNQHAAERRFGSEFMRHKRVAASETRAHRPNRAL